MRKIEDLCSYKKAAEKREDKDLSLLIEGTYLPDLYECKYFCSGYDKLICYTTDKLYNEVKKTNG